MLNKTKKTIFQWRHPCIRTLIDHGQRPITGRVVFTSLYKGYHLSYAGCSAARASPAQEFNKTYSTFIFGGWPLFVPLKKQTSKLHNKEIESKRSHRLEAKQCRAFWEIIGRLRRFSTHDSICRASLVSHWATQFKNPRRVLNLKSASLH